MKIHFTESAYAFLIAGNISFTEQDNKKYDHAHLSHWKAVVISKHLVRCCINSKTDSLLLLAYIICRSTFLGLGPPSLNRSNLISTQYTKHIRSSVMSSILMRLSTLCMHDGTLQLKNAFCMSISLAGENALTVTTTEMTIKMIFENIFDVQLETDCDFSA